MTPIDPSIRILDEHRNNFSLLREIQHSQAHLMNVRKRFNIGFLVLPGTPSRH